MAQIMCRLPVVECFIAVLYRREYRCDQVRSEETVEG